MTENIVINKPSKKLEELMHKIGIKKHERLDELKHQTHFDEVIILK